MALTSGAVSLTSRSATSIVVAGAVATGGSGTYTYQWYRSVGVDYTWAAISGATTATSVTDSTVASGQLYSYLLVATDTGTPANGSVVSAVVGPVMAYTAGVGNSVGYTYSAATSSFTPVATPTDFLNIFGSSSKTVLITRIEVTGLSSAATAATLNLSVVKRSTAGTAGSAVLTALTATPMDSNNSAATAVVSTVGTANYTTLGTLVGIIKAAKLPLTLSPFTATDFPISPMVAFSFTDRSEQGVILRGTSEQLALNLNGATLPAGTSLNVSITWIEL